MIGGEGRAGAGGVAGRLGRGLWRGVADYWLAIAIVASFFGGWEASTRLFNVPTFELPSLSLTIRAMITDRDNLVPQIGVTLQEIAPGLALGILIGFLLAVLMARSKTLERGLYPLLIATQAVPVPAIAAALVIILGYNIWPKIVVIVLSVFFPIAVNEFVGLTSVDPEQINLMRSMRASNWQIFRYVRLPASLPLFFAGAKLAATYSVIGAVFAEWLGSDQGLGAYLQQQNAQLRTPRVFAAILVLAALGILLFIAVGVVERICTPWRRRATK